MAARYCVQFYMLPYEKLPEKLRGYALTKGDERAPTATATATATATEAAIAAATAATVAPKAAATATATPT